MFYLAQLYLNVEDKVQPFLSQNIYDQYETHAEAFKNYSDNIYTGHIPSFDSDELPVNSVTDYSVDIFNGYHKILMVVKADTYDNCLDTVDRWALDYLNDIWKTKWLEDQLKDLPVWFAVLGHEAPEAPLDILHIEEFDRNLVAIAETYDMFTGMYEYLTTNLSHIIVAKRYLSTFDLNYLFGPTPACFELVIQAENEEAMKEVCRDFIRLYGDEYD